jgi:hypothetical protein
MSCQGNDSIVAVAVAAVTMDVELLERAWYN